ncbi:MAG: hypothetical protein F6K17_12910 [Okeania sp. SIO3C4]|nr:hypothetical protein [Okeania sp. SIO3C4]
MIISVFLWYCRYCRYCQSLNLIITDPSEHDIIPWQTERNQTASKVSWQFSTDDATVKLKHLYPVFETA